MDGVPSSFVIWISFCSVLPATGDIVTPKKDSTAVYKEVESKFNRLLDAIAYINEKRLNALKSYTELEWDNPTSGILRNIEKENNEHISTIHKINRKHTADIIEDALHDIICRHDSRKATGMKKRRTKNNFKQIIKNNLRSETEIPNSSKFYYRTRISSSQKDKDLRKSDHKAALRSSCWKEAYKSCKKACKSALSDVCDDYRCSKSMKKYFKKDCKNNCKDRLS